MSDQQQDKRLSKESAPAVIAFALSIEDHFERESFLHCWNVGDLNSLNEWPEFTGDIEDRARNQ